MPRFTDTELREEFKKEEFQVWSSKFLKFTRLPDSSKDEIADFWLHKFEVFKDYIRNEIEGKKLDLDARKKELCGSGGCSKTNRRLHMHNARGRNQAFDDLLDSPLLK